MGKKLISQFLMLLVLSLILVACNQGGNNSSNESEKSSSSDSGSSSGSGQEVLVLKSSIQSPPEAALTKGFDIFLDKIEEKSDGRIKFERYYSESLAAAEDQMNAVSNKIADIALVVPSYTPAQLPLANIGSNPALWKDTWVGETAYYKLYDTVPAMQDELAKNDIKWVGQYATPSYYVISTKEVRSIDDIKGLKVIATGGLAKLAAELGANVVGIPITESYEAMERGTVDAVFYGYSAGATYGLDESAKYIFQLPLGSTAGLYMMNADVYEGLPDDIKQIIKEVALEHPKDFHQIYQIDGEGKALNKFVENGTELIKPSEEDMKKLEEAAQKIWNDWSSQNEGGEEILNTFRQLIEESNKENPFAN